MQSSLAILSVCLLLFRTGECAATFTFPVGGFGFVNLNAAATTIATIDSTGGTGALTYAIDSQVPTGIFQIATATSGVITLAATKSVVTTTAVHILSISVTDTPTSGPAVPTTGKLYITVNTATPAFSATTICTEIASTLAIDSIIGIYKATDADAGTTLTYALSTSSTLFELNSATGVLTARVAVTSSTSATSTVIIHAKDTGASKTGTATVTILKGGTCPSASDSDSGATVLSAAVMTTAGALAMLHFF